MVLKLPKEVHLWQICADLSKKSKSIKNIYLYPSERLHHAISENSMFYRGLNNSSKKVLTHQRFNKIHQLLFLKERNENFQMHIHKFL